MDYCERQVIGKMRPKLLHRSRRELAKASGYSSREVSRLLSGKVAATPQSIAGLQAGINTLEKEKKETEEILSRVDQAIEKIGLRKFAALAGIDHTNLNKSIKGNRRPSLATLAKLQSALIRQRSSIHQQRFALINSRLIRNSIRG